MAARYAHPWQHGSPKAIRLFHSTEGDGMAEKRGWKRRLVKGLVWGMGGFVVVTALLVLVFRFVPVGVSALMVERKVEAWHSGRPYTARHRWVPLDEISPNMGVAVIAGEDQNFPDHFGFDWTAIEKAYVHNEHSRRKRGASTVSQQTAKNVFLWGSRSWVRKGFEVWFTLLLETEWPKRRILEVYLNSVEFGDGVYGVEAASHIYFGKSASRLTPSEAALLAAVLPNPHKYRVNAPSEYVRGRQAWILRQMRQLGGPEVVKQLEGASR
jgi:monofunctional biosynthetic peptidoglycan transglycosylase